MLKMSYLSSGYFHIRGQGPCQWVQVPRWPCDEATIRKGAFLEADEAFIQEVITWAIVYDEQLDDLVHRSKMHV